VSERLPTVRACYDASPYRSYKHATYFPVYDALLAPYRGRPITFMEVGVLNGGSLHMWRRFFGPDARIIGVDRNPLATRWEADGFEIVIGDQGDPGFWAQLFAQVGPVDVVLDDGGHTNRQQIVTTVGCLPHLRDGGLLIVEDTHASYLRDFGNPNPRSFVSFAKHVVDLLHTRFPGVPAPASAVGQLLRDTVAAVVFHESIVVFQVDRERCVMNSPTVNAGQTLDAEDFRFRDEQAGWVWRVAGPQAPLRRIRMVDAMIRRLVPWFHGWRQRRETAGLARYFR